MTISPNALPEEWTPKRALDGASTVYHYTTAEGLLGMVENGTLWATEATGLNDVAEVIQGRECISEWLSDVVQSETTEWLAQTFASMATGDGWLMPNERSEVFVLCASLDGNDAHQWRNYAVGNGYAIALDATRRLAVTTDGTRDKPATFVNSAGRRSLRNYFDAARCSPWRLVAYGETDSAEMLSDLLRWAEAVREWSEVAPAGDPETEEPHPTEVARQLAMEALFAASCLIKNEGFRGEREARVIVTLGFVDAHARYRASPYGLVRYVRVTEPSGRAVKGFAPEPADSWRLPIRGVRLGPAPYSRQGEPTVRAFLEKHGYASANVTSSQVPVRLS